VAYVLILGWFCAGLALSCLTGHLWIRIAGRVYPVIVLPGVIVHELSHAAGCLVTGATITRMTLFDVGRARVEHSRPRIPVVGQAVISLAPVAGGILVMWGLCVLVAPAQPFGLPSLPVAVSATPEGIGAFVQETATPVVRLVSGYLAGLDYGRVRTYVYLYLLISVAITWGPSRQDLRNALISLAGCAGLLVILHLAAAALDREASLRQSTVDITLPVVTFVVSTLVLLLMLTTLVWVIVRLAGEVAARTSRRRRASGAT